MSITYSTELLSSGELWALYNTLGWADFLKLSGDQLHLAMQQSWYVIYAYLNGQLIGYG